MMIGADNAQIPLAPVTLRWHPVTHRHIPWHPAQWSKLAGILYNKVIGGSLYVPTISFGSDSLITPEFCVTLGHTQVTLRHTPWHPAQWSELAGILYNKVIRGSLCVLTLFFGSDSLIAPEFCVTLGHTRSQFYFGPCDGLEFCTWLYLSHSLYFLLYIIIF
jgi:hypothetical protein